MAQVYLVVFSPWACLEHRMKKSMDTFDEIEKSERDRFLSSHRAKIKEFINNNIDREESKTSPELNFYLNFKPIWRSHSQKLSDICLKWDQLLEKETSLTICEAMGFLDSLVEFFRWFPSVTPKDKAEGIDHGSKIDTLLECMHRGVGSCGVRAALAHLILESVGLRSYYGIQFDGIGQSLHAQLIVMGTVQIQRPLSRKEAEANLRFDELDDYFKAEEKSYEMFEGAPRGKKLV